MFKHLVSACVVCTVAFISACGGGSGGGGDDNGEPNVDTSTERGTLIQNPPPRVASWSAPVVFTLTQAIRNGQGVLELVGSPRCGIDVHRIDYQTVDALDQPTAASGVLMVPTGDGSCTGPRPIVLYAHGTSTDRDYNLSDVDDTNNPAFAESMLIAAVFAAQGYIVVAPNYAGYDSSTLGYHPFLNADQQSKDMIDTLTAARKALGNVPASDATDNGQLFISGYSQGGHVAMATHRAMEEAGLGVTASAPLSGPYALVAFLDAIVFGQVNLSATQFMPLVTTSYQTAYGNLYAATNDIYEDPFAQGIDTLLPSSTSIDDLIDDNRLPRNALFSDTTPITGDATLDAALARPADPLFARGFGTPNLVRNSVRLAYAVDARASPDGASPATRQPGVPIAANPTYPLRVAAKRNDLRTWRPTAPVLLCGGNADPTVFYGINTLVMQAFWSDLPAGVLSVVDIDSPSTGPDDPYAPSKASFATAKDALESNGGQDNVIENYHVTVAPFCTGAAGVFFNSLR